MLIFNSFLALLRGRATQDRSWLLKFLLCMRSLGCTTLTPTWPPSPPRPPPSTTPSAPPWPTRASWSDRRRRRRAASAPGRRLPFPRGTGVGRPARPAAASSATSWRRRATAGTAWTSPSRGSPRRPSRRWWPRGRRRRGGAGGRSKWQSDEPTYLRCKHFDIEAPSIWLSKSAVQLGR